jgi:hypothetical protein
MREHGKRLSIADALRQELYTGRLGLIGSFAQDIGTVNTLYITRITQAGLADALPAQSESRSA